MLSPEGMGVSGFTHPPVAETVMGLEFMTVPGLGIWELVTLQTQWSDSLPEHQVLLGAPPNLDHQVIPLSMPPMRVWLSNSETGLLLQTQADRFMLNWRRTNSARDYPGYDEVLRPEFARKWGEFLAQLDALGMDRPTPLIAEFTYVKQITGERLSVPASTLALLPNSLPNLPGSEHTLVFQTTRTLEVRRSAEFPGQLSITAHKSGHEEVLHLTITTRVEVGSDSDPIAALDFARKTSKHAFLSVTEESAQQTWGPQK